MKKKFFLKSVLIVMFFLNQKGISETTSQPLIVNDLLQSANFFKKAQEFTLSNGMHFVVMPNHRFPVVTQRLLYKVGSADDPVGKSGMAHLLEHLMFSLGTSNAKAKEFTKIFLNAGSADNNAYTSFDATCYESTFPTERTEKVFQLEADRMVNLKFDEAVIENEKKIVWEEHLVRIENNSQGKLEQLINGSLFWVHPYKVHPGGWSHELTAAPLEELQQFYKKWYTPANAICVIVGDITVEKAKQLAEKYYGKISGQVTPVRQRPVEPKHFKETIKIDFEHQKDGGRSLVRLIYPMPSIETDLKKLLIFKLLQCYLQSGSDSYLHRKLVNNKKIAAYIGIHFEIRIDPSFFDIYAAPLSIEDRSILDKIIVFELKNFLTEGITWKDLEVIKKKILFAYIGVQENLTEIASNFIDLLGKGYSLEQLKLFDKVMKAITIEDFMGMAKEIFKNLPRMVVSEKYYNLEKQEDE